jgi:hypothetical protein
MANGYRSNVSGAGGPVNHNPGPLPPSRPSGPGPGTHSSGGYGGTHSSGSVPMGRPPVVVHQSGGYNPGFFSRPTVVAAPPVVVSATYDPYAGRYVDTVSDGYYTTSRCC